MIEWAALVKVARQTSDFYWLLALILIALAIWKGRTALWKSIWTLALVAVFAVLPVKAAIDQTKRDAYEREAWAYFRKKCDTEAGEKIYKTFTGVKNVLIVKPLPPASDKDNFDQFWYGDPYSASANSVRTEVAASVLSWANGPNSPTERGRGFDFVESVVRLKEEKGQKFIKYSYPKEARDHIVESIDHPVSRFAISWEDISTEEDRKYWIAASRLRAIDLADNSIVAERVGFLIEAGFGSTSSGRRPWLAARGLGQNGRLCPDTHDYSDRWFLLKVFGPAEGGADGK
jgi:hypothetical protein